MGFKFCPVDAIEIFLEVKQMYYRKCLYNLNKEPKWLQWRAKKPSTYSRDKIDEIKSLLDIVDVIGLDINLHHKGGEYFCTVVRAGDSGESLKVDKNLQVWKDFKNGAGGDILDWIKYNFGYILIKGADFSAVLHLISIQSLEFKLGGWFKCPL